MPKCWSKSSKQASIGRAAAVLMFASAVRDGRAMHAPSARPSTAIIGPSQRISDFTEGARPRIGAPIAKALMKAHPGDIVDLRAPAGVDQIEVLAIRYVSPIGASGRSPAKTLSMIRRRARVHGRRLAWRFGWQRSGDRSVLGCAVRASGGVAAPQRARV